MARHLTTTDIVALTSTTLSVSGTKKTITGASSGSGVTTITATGHGYSTGDWVYQAAIGGAVEANSIFQITKVDNNSYTIPLASVTTYTSGGTAQKITMPTFAGNLTPNDLKSLMDSLHRVPQGFQTDDNHSSESSINTILGGVAH